MSGHGHVVPNPDGSRARCGGPAICKVCAQELAQQMASGNIKSMQMRLAFRTEGAFVNCYFAGEASMKDALPLASMRKTVLDAQPEVWERFKALMQDVLGHHIKEVVGVTPIWTGERKAPEHERTKDA